MRTRLSVSESGFAKIVTQSRFAPRLLVIMAVLLLSGVAALARGPVFSVNTNLIIMPQGGATNILFTIQDDAVGWSGIQTTTAAFVTNGIFSNSILTVTNFAAPYGPPPSWTNKYSLETNMLTIVPGNQFGTNKIVLISTDLWGDSTTNTWTLDVYHVSQPPVFSLATNNLEVLEESGRQTNHNFVTGITNGAGNPPGLTWKFTTTVSPTTATNGGLTFLTLPAITNYNGTNGLTADLVFAPTNHSYGSNLVSVIMTDSGTSVGGGQIASTNTFWLVVSKIAHPPVFAAITNRSTLENGAGLTGVVISVSGDAPGSPLGLTAISPNTNMALVSVTGTNVVNSTNSTFTLAFTPALNAFGSVTNQLIASEVVGNNTNNILWSTNYVVLTVTHVSQPPSFALATNALVVLEESGAHTNVNFATNIVSGAGNPFAPLSQLTFAVTTVTNAAGNAQFAVLPSLAITNGVLTFAPKPHSFGTNVVTVTMTDLAENTNNGGVKTFSRNFLLEVTQTSHVPTITPVASQTTLENGGGTNVVINVWNYDATSNNLALTATSAAVSTNAASVVHVSFVSTNVISATNTQFTLHLAPVSNSYGTNVITLTASELVGTHTTSSTNFQVTVAHVTQAPSFVFATTNVTTLEQAVTVAITNANFLTSITNGPGNLPPGTNWTFALNAANKALFSVQPAIAHNGNLTFTPTRLTNGTSAVTVVMTDTDAGESTASGGVTTFTNSFTLGVTFLSQTPSFSFATNTLVVPEEAAAQTNLNFVTAINTGLGKAGTVTWSFTTVTATNDPVNNAQFTAWPLVATNGTLTFTPTAHSYGTNLVTVVMTDSGGTNGSCTNSFELEVAQISHAPAIMWATNQTILENGGGLAAVVNVWDYDATASNFVLTAMSQNTNLALVSVTATNVINPTNVQFTVTYTPVLNAFGATDIVLTASEAVGTNLLSSTTNLLLTVGQVSQPPSFAFATNVLVEPEHAGPISLNNFLTGINTGAGNPPGLTWTFAVVPNSSPGNVTFAPFQSPAVTTNGTLTFDTLDYAYGTNVVTLVMTDSGIVVNGGVIAFTNSFTIQVPWVNQAPSFGLGISSTTVDKYNVPVTVSNTAINVLAGPSNESSQTVAFHVSNNNSNLFTVQPAVDPNGTLTFTPGDQSGTAIVQINAQDNGGTANGGVDTSSNQTFTIIIPPNTFENAAGTYAGLFYGSNTLATASSGYLNLALTTNGVFSGYLLCGNDTNSFNGQFNISQSAATVQAGNYALNLAINTSSQAISGSVSNTVSDWNSMLIGYMSGYGDALDGAYTMVMPGFDVPKVGSVGDSVFTVTIAGGIASLTGNLSDSNQVVQASPLCANGFSPVYLPLYTNASGANGMLIGWLNFNGVASDSTSPDSALIWISDTNATSLYPHGFTNNVAPLISTFDATQTQLLPINKGYVEMTGGSLSIPLVEAVTIVNNQVLVDSSITNGLNLTINTNTGEVQGSFVDGSGNTNLIESTILQNDGVARGYFLGAGQSGSFILVANAVLPDNPPYPAFTGITPHGAVTAAGVTPAGITDLVIPENATNDLRLSFALYDPLTSTFTVTCNSANTNIVAVSLSGGNQLLFAPVANVYGSNVTVTITADDGTLTNTFIINTTIGYVNQVPSFTLATNAYTVDKYGLTMTYPNAVTNISVGPPSESWQTVSFIVTNSAPSLFLVQPAVDASGTLTFTPGNVGGTVTVGVQAQDTGGTANNGVNTSASQLVTITIPSNPYGGVLTGPNNTGTFIGLFTDTNAATPPMNSSGYFSLVLTNDGTFNGFLICAGATNAFAGQFSIAQSNATVTLANYTLNLVLDPGAATVNGSIVSTSPSWTATLQSYLSAAPALAGTYLVALPGLSDPTAGPVGDSAFTVTVGTNGVASLTGYLADNTSVSLTSQLSAAGNCPIYLPIYTNNANTGLLFGWLTFTNDAADNLTAGSALTWENNVGATPALYPAGFTNQAVAVASIYTNSAPNELPGISYYAVLTGGSFGTSLVTNAVNIVSDSITVDPLATDALSLSIDEVTGALTGSFVNGGVTNYIESVILQDATVASGYFTTASGNQAGSFVLLANYTVPTGYTYPEATGLTNVTLLENSGTFNMAFTLFDPLTNNFASVTAVSADTGFATVNVTGSGTAYTLQITPVTDSFTNSVAVSVISTDGTLTSTNTINVTVTWVNQAPTYTLNPTTLTVDQYNVPVIISNAVTAISAGPDNGGGIVNFIVTNNINGLFVAQPAVDGNGTLTFTPGFQGGTIIVGVQGHDNRGTANGGVDTSASQMFTIVIPQNQFQNVTGTNSLTAAFTGLFYDTNGTIPSSSGYVTLTLTNDGSFNISLVNAGATNAVNGVFSVSNASANVAVANYALGLTIDTVAGTVIGSVSNAADSWNAELTTYVAATPALTPGSYTVTLPGFDDLTQGPVGYSAFNVVISSNGAATLNGYMADNTPVSQTALLSAAGYCPIYIPLYPNGTNGLLLGWLTFTNDPTFDSLTDGSSLMWFNAAGATPDLYPDGFTNQAVALASPYATNSIYSTDLLGSSSSAGYGYLMLSGGDLGADPVVKKMGITNNVISVVSTSDHSVNVSIIPNTGMIQGWYLDTKGFSNNIEGVIFQNGAFASGYFIGVNTNQSGLFMLFGN
jgi:hypothetical protein